MAEKQKSKRILNTIKKLKNRINHRNVVKKPLTYTLPTIQAKCLFAVYTHTLQMYNCFMFSFPLRLSVYNCNWIEKHAS